MKNLFYVLIVGPMESLLLIFFILFQDFGLAILFFSILLRIFILPISFFQLLEENKLKQIKKRLEEETKNIKDLLKKAEIINNIYKEEKFNPLRNIFLQFLLIPIYLGSVVAIFNNLKFVNNLNFLNLINLSKPYLPLGVIVILLNFYYITKQSPESRKIALFILGVISIIILTIPSALLLYFLVNLLFALGERQIFNRYLVKFTVKSVEENDS